MLGELSTLVIAICVFFVMVGIIEVIDVLERIATALEKETTDAK